MTDVLLVQPPIRDFYLTAKRTIPYGLACVAAALEAKRFSVQILDGLATDRSRSLPLPAELNHLQEFYGRPDASPFSLFNRFRHFGFSFEHIARNVRENGGPRGGRHGAPPALHVGGGRPPRDRAAGEPARIPGSRLRVAR